ncbi:MAG TPA: NAD(P)-dependent oxidoreductase [Alphaproteobacteria bacterium]|nr:NAD(P)-dependent oxidoreductase [Alphaproteobacteria bacterium]
MRILVTGGSGFLGSHVADALTEAGHETIVFDRAPSRWIGPKQRMIVGDVLDAGAVATAMEGCGAVYHLAALADIDAALERPRETVEVNIMGTVNLLEAARAAKIGRFVFSSSIYVYSRQGSFYRTTKQACEHLIEDYRERFGLAYTILRYGSLYGPRADRSNYLHSLLAQALEARRMDHYGTGDEVREYIHVRDAAAMSVDVLAPEFADQIIHLAGRERMTSRDMLAMIREMLGGDVTVNFENALSPGHYVQTPYNYTPRLGRRLTRDTYIDLGLGLLDCLQQIDAERTQER